MLAVVILRSARSANAVARLVVYIPDKTGTVEPARRRTTANISVSFEFERIFRNFLTGLLYLVRKDIECENN